MEKQSKHFVDDDVRKKNKQNTNIFLFFFFFYSVGCFSVCGKKKINKLKKEEKKKLPLSSSFKNTQNQRVLGSNWHANTPSQNKKEKKINKKKKKKMREKSIRCLSTPSVDAAILSEMALQTMREKRRRRRRWWNTIKNKNNKSIQQQATTTVCGASRPTGICASVCSEVRAVLLLLWWFFFFSIFHSYYFQFCQECTPVLSTWRRGGEYERKRRTKYNSRERVSIALDWKSNLIASHAKPLTERTPGCSDVSNNNTNGHPKKFGWKKKKAAMKKKKRKSIRIGIKKENAARKRRRRWCVALNMEKRAKSQFEQWPTCRNTWNWWLPKGIGDFWTWREKGTFTCFRPKRFIIWVHQVARSPQRIQVRLPVRPAARFLLLTCNNNSHN